MSGELCARDVIKTVHSYSFMYRSSNTAANFGAFFLACMLRRSQPAVETFISDNVSFSGIHTVWDPKM